MAAARRISDDVARPVAADVDRTARFPAEAFAALRETRLLSALIPRRLGGPGCSTACIADICALLARACGSSGLIFAMHQIQVACLVRHAPPNSLLHDLLCTIARDSLLIASATSEVGTHGDLRSSLAALESTHATHNLRKACPAISYGAQADAILVTARRDPAAGPADQVLVLLRKSDYQLEQTGTWDTLGMRGTCSPAFQLNASFAPGQVFPQPFKDIAAQTMVPYSHLFWAAVWLGIASDAVGICRESYRATARRSGSAAGIMSEGLANACAKLDGLVALVRAAVAACGALEAQGPIQGSMIAAAINANNVKIAASDAVCEICLECLRACGLRGYTNAGPGGLGRHIRDALSAPIMISNDRLAAINRTLLLIDNSDAPLNAPR